MRHIPLSFLAIATLLSACETLPSKTEKTYTASETTRYLDLGYDANALSNLKTVTLSSDRRVAWPGQGQTSSYVEFATDRMIKHFDFVESVGSVERWTLQNANFYHNRYLADENGETVIDYATMTYEKNPDSSYASAFIGDMRSSDILLAKTILENPDVVQSVSSGYYQGHPSQILDVELAANTPRLSVYVSKTDGLIRRVTMERPFGEVNIVFGSHQETDGYTHASESWFFMDGTGAEYEPNIRFEANRKRPDLLKRDTNLTPAPTLVDLSQMTADEIGVGRYLVGRDDYAQFVEHDGAYIVVNAYAGLEERYEALNEMRGLTLPISHVVVTHHHSDRIASVTEALELGAEIVMSAETVGEYEKPEYAPLNSKPPIIVNDGDQLGPLVLYVRPTSHSVENLFVFDTVTGHLFQDDHYHGLVEDQATRIQPTAFELYDFIKDTDLDVKYLLSGHARKVETWPVFEAAVLAAGSPSICPSRRYICSDAFADDSWLQPDGASEGNHQSLQTTTNAVEN